MPKRYAREFRRAVCGRLVAGEKVAALSKELEVFEATLYLWKRQALIDAGRAEGIKSFEADEPVRVTSTAAVTSATSGTLNTEESVDFSDYGAPLSITAPPPADVMSFSQFLQSVRSASDT